MRQELKGRVEHIAQTRTFDSGFQVRDFVIEIGEQYPQYIKLQFDRDNCQKLDAISEGMIVHVEYFLNGRKWNGPEGVRYFTTLRASNIEVLDSKGLDQTVPTSSIPPKVDDVRHHTPALDASEVPKAADPSKIQEDFHIVDKKGESEEDTDMPF